MSPAGRKRDGQPGHPGAFRSLLPGEQVDEVVVVLPELCSHLTAFFIGRSRGGAALEALLGEQFGGIVGSDRWSAYGRFPAERRALCYAHLKRDFQALVDRGGEAEPLGRWGLAEIARLFALWHRFRAGEFDRKALQRRLVLLQARLGRLVWRGEGQCRPQSDSAVPGARPVVGRTVDVCAGERRGANEQCRRTRPAAGRAVAQRELWLEQCHGQSLRGAALDGRGNLPAARPAAERLPKS